jgi:hypothetical protein
MTRLRPGAMLAAMIASFNGPHSQLENEMLLVMDSEAKT